MPRAFYKKEIRGCDSEYLTLGLIDYSACTTYLDYECKLLEVLRDADGKKHLKVTLLDSTFSTSAAIAVKFVPGVVSCLHSSGCVGV
jgi:hypothetical protein